MAYVVLVVNYVFPAIDRSRFATGYGDQGAGERTAGLVHVYPRVAENEDALYYLKRDTPSCRSCRMLRRCEAVRTHGQGRIVTEEQHMMSLQRLGGWWSSDPGVSAARPKTSVLLSVNAKT